MTDSCSRACAARLRLRSRGECPPTRPAELVGEFRLRSSTLAYILKYCRVSSDELRAARVRNRMYQGAMALARAHGRPRFAVTCTGAAWTRPYFKDSVDLSKCVEIKRIPSGDIGERSCVDGAVCRSRADAMRDACAEAARLRARVRELEARLRHAMRDVSAEAVRLRERVRELEARLRHAQRGRSVHPFGRTSGCGPEETLCSAGCGMRHSKSTGPPLPRLGSKKKWTCNVCEPTVCLKRDPLLQRHVMPAGPHRGHVLS